MNFSEAFSIVCRLFNISNAYFVIYCSVAPTIVVRQDDIHASFGQKVVLECISESHPNSFNYFLAPSGKKIVQGNKMPGRITKHIWNFIFGVICISIAIHLFSLLIFVKRWHLWVNDHWKYISSFHETCASTERPRRLWCIVSNRPLLCCCRLSRF